MAFGRVIISLTFVVIALVAVSQGENSTSSTTTVASTSTTSASTPSSTTTSTTTAKTPVPDRPVKEPGCYWTPCKSPITYDIKCPPETEEQNQNDEMPCEGIFVKYQCCPRKDVPATLKPMVVDEGAKVIPQGV